MTLFWQYLCQNDDEFYSSIFDLQLIDCSLIDINLTVALAMENFAKHLFFGYKTTPLFTLH